MENRTDKSTECQNTCNTETAAEKSTSTEIYRKSDNLELYLKDVYENECVFKTGNEEIQFLQTGVEDIVNSLAEELCKSTEKLQLYSGYFGGRWANWCKPRILNVGSYYEKTKNHFPNEFDFIILLGDNDRMPLNAYRAVLVGKLLFTTISLIKTIIAGVGNKVFRFTNTDPRTGATRKLCVEGISDIHGPAAQLTCIYEKDSCDKTTIHIDVTPAFQVTDKETLVKMLQQECELEPFYKEVLSTGSILCIGKRLSFTETEVHFMKNVLSENHVRVYRILKYFINGNGDGETLDKYVEGKGIGKGYSSYNIKTLMIYHHYKCKNSETEKIGPCIIEMLADMSRYPTLEDFPSLSIPTWRYKVTCKAELCLRRYIPPLMETLRSMQAATDSYEYERDRIQKSMSQQYLDEPQSPK